MPSPVSDRTRSLISRSLPLVQQRRDQLVEHMERNLAAAETEVEPYGQAELTAMVLVELLLVQARTLVESARFGPLDDVRFEHRALDIAGRHYSRFGDALVPILRDLLGPTSPREVAAAWCDTFWAIIRAALPAEEEVRVEG